MYTSWRVKVVVCDAKILRCTCSLIVRNITDALGYVMQCLAKSIVDVQRYLKGDVVHPDSVFLEFILKCLLAFCR